MTQQVIHGVTVECRQGGIAAQPDMDAIVNAANAELRIGGGVAGAIHSAAGRGLEQECQPLAPIRPGQAVITSAHNLPNQYVIHCLGPVYGIDEPADELLASCYREALALTEKNGIRSIAFPAISTGAFGYPADAAADIVFSTLAEFLPHVTVVRHICFVLYGEQDLKRYTALLDALAADLTQCQ
ncbi:MAG: macro domain-containing protein [Woeseia sp.]